MGTEFLREYESITCNSIHDLIVNINKKIKEGWFLYDIFVTPNDRGIVYEAVLYKD